jgi:transposase InsO family protein
MRNHAREVLACDVLVTVTARFCLVYVFIVLEIGTRRLVHWNVTEHHTAAGGVQQFCTCITDESAHRVVVHDRDRTYSKGVDTALRAMGLRVLKTPVAVPQANAYCERVIGKARRECLDWMIPLNERISVEFLPSACLITIAVAHTHGSALDFRTRHRSSSSVG